MSKQAFTITARRRISQDETCEFTVYAHSEKEARAIASSTIIGVANSLQWESTGLSSVNSCFVHRVEPAQDDS